MLGQEIYDFQIDEILNMVLIKTSKDWNLGHLVTKDHWILAYTIDGSCSYFWEREHYMINKGDALFFSQGFTRSARTDSNNPWCFIVIKFRMQFINDETSRRLMKIPNYLPHIPKILSSSFIDAEVAWRRKRPGYKVQCKSILYNILFNILRLDEQSRTGNAHANQICRVLALIDKNLDRNYTLEYLAGEAGMSISFFRTVFKHYTGFSVIKYQKRKGFVAQL